MNALSLILLKHKIIYSGIRHYAKEIKFGNEGKSLLLKGAETLANVVSVTLGPKGGHVIVDASSPKISKDGVFLAKSVILPDQYENIGAQIMKKMAETTQKGVSNCTKTATVLAHEIAKEGYKRIVKGSNPIEIRKGILEAVEVASKHLDEISQQIENSDDVAKIATMFADNDGNLGRIVAEAFRLVGKDGVITVKEIETPSEDVSLSRGMVFESGYYVTNFPIDKGSRIKLENALIIIYDRKLDHFNPLVPVLEMVVAKHKNLIIIAEDFSPNIAVTFAVNNEAVLGVQIVCVKIPPGEDFDKEILKDLAFASGGKVYDNESCGKMMDKIDESYFGEIPEVLLTKKEMFCVHGDNELVLQKVEDLRTDVENAKDEDERKKLKERLERLESSIAIITINGTDKEDAKNLKEKIYTIIESTRVAIEEGVVPGGGIALLSCMNEVNQITSSSDDHRLGVKILASSLSAPFNKIIKNGQESPPKILHQLKTLPPAMGYDIIGQEFVDMFQAGIVDPTKAVKSALRNAANVASLVVTTEAVVIYKFDGNEIIL